MARLLKLAVVWLAVVFVAHHLLQDRYVEQVLAIRNEDQQRMDELEKSAASAESARRMEAHLAVSTLGKEHEEALAKAWGGGLGAIPKDFRLNLAGMLRSIALGVVPEGSTVELSVERFTDFALHVELPSARPVAELATMSGRILELSAPYLHRLSFFADRRLIGEVDPLSIESVQRGKLPARELITRALVTSVRDEPKPPPVAAGPKISKERSSETTAPFDRVIEEWSDGYGGKLTALVKVIEKLGEAVNMRTLKTRGDVTLRLKSVDAAREEIARAEKYFPTCLAELKTKLTPTADSLATSISMRHVESVHGEQIRQTGPLLVELTAFQSGVRRLLQTLDAPGAAWEIAERGTITFRSQATLDAFNLRMSEVESMLPKVDAAAKAWSTAGATK